MNLEKVGTALTDDVMDAIGTITGFPTKTATILLTDGVIPWIRSRFEDTYLDWELENWPHIYHGERQILTITYRNTSYRLPQVTIFDNSIEAIPNSKISVSKASTSFVIPKEIKAKTEEAFSAYMKMLKWRRRTYHNDNNVRLTDLAVSAGRATLTVQDVEYENYVRTNLVLDRKISHHESTLRKLIHGNGNLEPLSKSPLANNLGVNILVFTVDGQLVVQKRSNSVIVRPNEYCPSASGTVMSADIPTQGTTLSGISLIREADEELGYRAANAGDIFLLGVTRELIRGGEPELFLVSKSDLSASEMRSRYLHARDRFESKNLQFFQFDRYAFDERLDTPDKISRFSSLVDAFIDQFKDRMSIPLWTAIALWKNARLANVPLFAG